MAIGYSKQNVQISQGSYNYLIHTVCTIFVSDNSFHAVKYK